MFDPVSPAPLPNIRVAARPLCRWPRYSRQIPATLTDHCALPVQVVAVAVACCRIGCRPFLPQCLFDRPHFCRQSGQHIDAFANVFGTVSVGDVVGWALHAIRQRQPSNEFRRCGDVDDAVVPFFRCGFHGSANSDFGTQNACERPAFTCRQNSARLPSLAYIQP